MRRVFLVVAVFIYVLRAMPQEDHPAAAFIQSARMATAKYRDRSVAIAEGYRKIGTDFPGMGEHWINIDLVFDNKFDPAHPEILTYADVAGTPQLLGVAYALPLLKGESAPEWPVGKEAWHDHFRTLEDETALPQHHTPVSAGDAPRITMLHAWIWLENPAGVFAADNWALPYFRLGMQPPHNAAPHDAPITAAKALSLVSGGAGYFAASIRAATGPLTGGEQKHIDAAFAQSHAAVEQFLRARPLGTLTHSELDHLSAIWAGLWKAVDASVSHKMRLRLQELPTR
ncbi:MAG TPA: hypothetical protein VIY49_20560 [Bryobacteraceae bacterium]